MLRSPARSAADERSKRTAQPHLNLQRRRPSMHTSLAMRRHRLFTLGVSVALLTMLAASSALAANDLALVSLSNRPDKLSGGDLLAAVHVPPGISISAVTITLNGNKVTSAFRPAPPDHALLGLVTGLKPGKNKLEAKAKGAGTAKLEIQNHPITGPVFSGPHQQPFFCQTHQFRVYPNGPFLTGSQ